MSAAPPGQFTEYKLWLLCDLIKDPATNGLGVSGACEYWADRSSMLHGNQWVLVRSNKKPSTTPGCGLNAIDKLQTWVEVTVMPVNLSLDLAAVRAGDVATKTLPTRSGRVIEDED